MRELHPDTKLHYVNVFDTSSLLYRELYELYNIDCPWTSVISLLDFLEKWRDLDEHDFVILWGSNPDLLEICKKRRFKIVLRYGEQVAPLIDGIPVHVRTLYERMLATLHLCDGVFVHSRFAVECLKSYKNVYFTPIGYRKEIYGEPDFDIEKKYDILFLGGVPSDPTNRRARYLPILSQKLGKRFHRMGGAYSTDRQRYYNSSKCVFHLSQSTQGAFESMRLWQSIGTSAVMIWEPKDCHPAEKDKHYIEVPWMTDNNIDEVINIIRTIPDRIDLNEIAKCAHIELSEYSPLKCIENYVIPASKLILGEQWPNM